MIEYVHSAVGITSGQLDGFFKGWLNAPGPDVHLRILQNSDEIVLALDTSTNKVIGFITAITDHVLSAYMPLLEVLPGYRNKKIGKTLTLLMLDRLKNYYMIDLSCDNNMQSFYQQCGMNCSAGMSIRNYNRQSGSISAP